MELEIEMSSAGQLLGKVDFEIAIAGAHTQDQFGRGGRSTELLVEGLQKEGVWPGKAEALQLWAKPTIGSVLKDGGKFVDVFEAGIMPFFR